MKTPTGSKGRGHRFSDGRKRTIEMRVVGKDEQGRFDKLMGDYHYLGTGRPVGDFLRQAAVCDGHWVGLLAWGSASYALKDRDEWIGWTPTLRAERLKLVIQNRRFLIPGKKGHQPNLASQILSAAVRALPQQWEDAFGYQPLVAETFTDMEQFAGTCYKASGWEPLGLTKGYSRHRADFFVPNDRPKKLWVKRLHTEALEWLCAPQLPEAYRGGGGCSAHGVLPLTQRDMESLHEALGRVKDPRASNKVFRVSSVLSITAMALLSGYRDVSQIHRFGQRLSQQQRKALALPCKKGTKFHRVPGYNVYWRLLAKMDLDQFAEVLSQWLSAHNGSLPQSLAMDGKMVRDTMGVLTLAEHETGRAHAMAPMSMKEGEGDRCELKSAQALIENSDDLSGKFITTDALHCQDRTARAIVERGGDYLVQVKDNQKTVHQCAQNQTAHLSPLLS
jgi:hypothetical protein